jgi:hypothetical protein
MTKNLAIITGVGDLSEEVMRFAGDLDFPYAQYIVTPWLPALIFSPARLLSELRSQSQPDIVRINPYHFAPMRRELKSRKVTHAFFTGDFPPERFIQAAMTRGSFRFILDSEALDYYAATPENRSPPVRYFLALARLLRDGGVEPLLACQVFPKLNLRAGSLAYEAPSDITGGIDELIVKAARAQGDAPLRSIRLSQAFIIDDGEIADRETQGTNDLLSRFQSKSEKKFPMLFKLPSVDFYPAFDQPTIGPHTVVACKNAGVRGIVFCAETTTVNHPDETVKCASDYKIFLYSIPFTQLRDLYDRNFPQTWAQSATIARLHP